MAGKKALEREKLVQDISITGVLICIFIQIAMVVLLPAEANEMENLIMVLVSFALMVLAALKINYIAMILSAVQVIVFVVYKIYRATALGEVIGWWSYLWIFLPPLTVLAMIGFMHVNKRLDQTNEILREQVEELVMVDALTHLPNLRSMYNDLSRQMANSKRWGQPVTLLIIQLRYYKELESILSQRAFREMRQIMAESLEKELRLEDRIYSLDEHGQHGVILICDQAGAAIAAARVKDRLEKEDTFESIKDRPIKIEIKMGYLQYDSETMQTAMEFRQKVENELQYDV